MPRCKLCDKPFVGAISSRKLCRSCRSRLEEDVKRRQRAIRDAVVTLQYGTNADAHADASIVLREHLGALIAYEEKGVLTLRPHPSQILEKLPHLRTTRVRSRPLADRSNPLTGVAFNDRFAEQEWFGEPDAESRSYEAASSGQSAGDRRRAHRSKVQCVVHLHPGGIRAIARDVSSGGTYIYSPRTRPKGTRLRVTLHTSSGKLDREGIVLRRERVDGYGTYTGGAGLAIQFRDAEAVRKPAPGRVRDDVSLATTASVSLNNAS